MKKDLESREDIEVLVNNFYEKIRQNEVLGHIFNDVAQVDWEKHLPKMYSFWEMILFEKAGYEGQPLRPHLAINQQHPLTLEHFGLWFQLFESTVDDYFEGVKATEVKARAKSIALAWASKIDYLNK